MLAKKHKKAEIDTKMCYIIAGPNGAGKTTFANEFLPVEAKCFIFVNADLIAKGLSPFQPEKVSLKAAKLMISEIDEHIKKGENLLLKQHLAAEDI